MVWVCWKGWLLRGPSISSRVESQLQRSARSLTHRVGDAIRVRQRLSETGVVCTSEARSLLIFRVSCLCNCRLSVEPKLYFVFILFVKGQKQHLQKQHYRLLQTRYQSGRLANAPFERLSGHRLLHREAEEAGRFITRDSRKPTGADRPPQKKISMKLAIWEKCLYRTYSCL